jgi:N-acetylglutamate synthase-like GNAT family acetyltransferase
MSLQVSALQNLPEVTVRFYRDADFDHAYRVIREIGVTHLGRNLRGWDKAFMELSGFMWVACVSDVPVAFAGLAPLRGDGIARLHTDLVSPTYQRRGLGTLLTLTRFAALIDDEVDHVGVLATEHSARYFRRFGFELEDAPQLDPFEGYHIHRMSMPYAPLVGQAADDLLDTLTQVSFDLTVEDDPFAGE